VLGQIYLITAATDGRDPVFLHLPLARQLVLALRYEQEARRAKTLAFVVMPDHLHWLMSLESTSTLDQVVGGVKSVVAHKAGRRIWQKGFHDHALRQEEDVAKIAQYIILNPVRAGLVDRPEDYPHWNTVWT
jgi:putative transposase